MTPASHGHRAATPAARPTRSRAGLVLALILVLVTGAALAFAGTVRTTVGVSEAAPQRVALSERVFSCPGGPRSARAVHGSVSGPVTRTAPVGEPLSRFSFPSSEVRGAFATESAGAAHWFAAQTCPEPGRRWWFVGVGGSLTHASVLTIDNPRPGTAVFDIDVYGERGPVEAPGLHGLTLPGGGTRSYALTQVAPAVGDLAVRIQARRGLVSASALETYSVGGIGKNLSEWVAAQPAASTGITLVGLPFRPGQATLLVANPGPVDAVAKLEVVGSEGRFAPRGLSSLTIGPGSVARMNIDDAFDGKPAALRLTANHPVVATVRSVLRGDLGYAANVGPLKGVTAFAVPAGHGGQLVLSAPDHDAVVEVITYAASSKRLQVRTVKVAGKTSVGVPLGNGVSHVRLASDQPRAVAGLVIDGRPGLATMAIPPALRAARLPVVRPAW